MKQGFFDNKYVVEQLRALGVLQACEILKVCLPTRVKYSEIKSALKSIVSKVQYLFEKNDPETLLVACLLIANHIPIDLYKLGFFFFF
jgi:myosin heavy subunit